MSSQRPRGRVAPAGLLPGVDVELPCALFGASVDKEEHVWIGCRAGKRGNMIHDIGHKIAVTSGAAPAHTLQSPLSISTVISCTCGLLAAPAHQRLARVKAHKKVITGVQERRPARPTAVRGDKRLTAVRPSEQVSCMHKERQRRFGCSGI